MTNLTNYQRQFWENLANNRNSTAIETADDSVTYDQIERIILDLDDKFDREQHLTFRASRSIESAIFTLFALMTGRSFSPISNKVPNSTIEYYLSQTSSNVLIEPKEVINAKSTNKKFENSYDFTNRVKSNHDTEKTQYILFTSGSTGTPKGVPISFKNLETYYNAAKKIINPNRNDIFSQTFDHSFDLAIHDILLSMSSFAKLIILNQDELRRPTHAISFYKITIWFSVPSLIVFFDRPNKINGYEHLRIAMFCGEKFFTEHAFYLHSLGVETIQNWYGPTEATIACSYYQFTSNETRETLPIGMPFDGSAFNYNEEDDGRQLLIGGDQVFASYTVANPDVFQKIDKKRYYKTGDLISISEGNIYIVGRNNSMVKINGYRIDLNEIENAASTIISNANIVALAANNNSSVCLIVENSLSITETEFLDHLAPLIPQYALPNKIYVTKEFPRNIAGKIDRKALAKKVQAIIEPDKEKNDLLSKLNKNVKISNLGLDSLDIMRLLLEIEKQTCKKLSFEQVEQFLNQTIGDILLDKDTEKQITNRKPQFLTKKHVFLNSRCRRYSVIYHKHRKFISDETKYIAIGSSGLFHALGSFKNNDANILNFCTPGMSLDAIDELCQKISLLNMKKIKIIFEIDPVMLTEERPRGDFLLNKGYVPRPPILNIGSSEYDYSSKRNGFASIEKTNNSQKMIWQEQREVVIKACYQNSDMWNDVQLRKIKNAYSSLIKSFESVIIFIQPLRSELKSKALKKLIARLLQPVNNEHEIRFIKLDSEKYGCSDFQDLNHSNFQGGEKFKHDLKKD